MLVMVLKKMTVTAIFTSLLLKDRSPSHRSPRESSRLFELLLQLPRPTVLNQLLSLSGWKEALMARCVALIRSSLGSPLPTADTPDMVTAPLTLPL